MTTRRTYSPVRLDFAPFMGVALLIIVFFVFTKAIRRPAIMGVTIPAGCRKYEATNSPSKIVSLFLLDKGQIGVMQHWQRDDMVELQRTSFGPTGLTALLENVKKSANGKVAVVIKPNQAATLKNVASVLEEIRRVDVPYLPLSELSDFEHRRLRYYEQMFIHRRVKETVFLQMQPYYCSIEED